MVMEQGNVVADGSQMSCPVLFLDIMMVSGECGVQETVRRRVGSPYYCDTEPWSFLSPSSQKGK